MAAPVAEPSHAVLAFTSNDRMHREFTLTPTATHGALNVSYADVGRLPEASPADTPTVLFLPGMFASRYIGLNLHIIAERLGVRVLIIDRPGMGHSTDVPLDQRVSIWVELVPTLLQHLGIQHVSLASHSAGTLYLLNTLHHCRNVLHPDRPFVALLAPWADPSHSKVTLWQAARLIPVGAFNIWNVLPKFSVLQARPALAFSAPLFNSIFSSSTLAAPQQENYRKWEEDYGLSRDIKSKLADHTMKSMFSESTAGANSEALLVLKKGPGVTWGACEDFGDFFAQLYSSERDRLAHASSYQAMNRLKIRVYFAESDMMIGNKGQEYLEACFKGGSGQVASNVVDFKTAIIPGSDHDSVFDTVAVLEEVLLQSGGHRPGPAA